jgi:ABC-type sugar transport system permease subunit
VIVDAALQGIPPEVYEKLNIDGAGGGKKGKKGKKKK